MDSSLNSLEIVELFSEKAIQKRVREIAKEIARKYLPIFEEEGKNFQLLFVGVLKGGEPFLSDLVREVSRFFPVGYIKKDYISVQSRRRGNKSGKVRLLLDTRELIEERHVILVEDIVDTGKTMAYLLPQFWSRGPASLELCVLINKTPNREKEVRIDYFGFPLVESFWLVGYGLDSEEIGRELPFIGYIKKGEFDSAGQP